MHNRTPFYQQHLDAHALMVDFFGWQMPLHYGSQIAEHNKVRQDAGMFDVSHMTVVDLLGAGGREFLRYLLANDVDRLSHPGKAIYSCMLDDQGGVLDDLIVYYRAPDNYRLILNSATRAKDLAWLEKNANGLPVFIQTRPELAMLAVQGPHAKEKLLSVLTPAQADAISTLQPFEAVDIANWFIARTGYTGEDGFECVFPAEEAETFWKKLLAAGVAPCGLGARDTLRLEAGMMLYGQDMDETTTPLESGLAWTVAWEPSSREFIGRAALEAQKESGVKRKMVGLILEDKGVIRPGYTVIVDGLNKGAVTSGTFSPTLEKSIALARVNADVGKSCQIDIRGKLKAAQVVAPRFVKHGKIIV
ncbi:MAG: glycine cleavage system aminomethyltransferase GcvT [Proteobacteria bacterium]|nr:glycine cleavage system aminomethyltransferase GcvT [Pseudomonadota bacterium]